MKLMQKIIIILLLCICLTPVIAQKSRTVEAATSARGMAVMEVNTGRLLDSKNADMHLPMASTTKVMTAIAVIEHTHLTDIVTVDQRAAGVEGSSVYLAAGEKLSVEDLLYCLMLQSGNDAAAALAYHVGGSLQGFADIMNQTATRIGAVNSNFVTPHGLHHAEHYTTAYDLALISAYGLRNSDFAKIVGAKQHNIVRESGRYPTLIVNKNKILSTYDGGTGVKTGFTQVAGRCLVASSMKNGMQVVSVVLNCGPMFEDCAELMDKAHKKYRMVEILPAYTHVGQLDVLDAKLENVHIYTKSDFSYPLSQGEEGGIYCRIEVPESVRAPLPKDSVVGKIKIYLLNQLLFSTEIYTIEDINKITYKDTLDIIIDKWLRR